MDFENCNSAAQFAIPQSRNTFIIPNATPFIEFGLNMLATGHVWPIIRIFDVTQPLSFAVLNKVERGCETCVVYFSQKILVPDLTNLSPKL